MTREDIERMTTAPDCFVPTPEVVRELARRALAPDRARRVGEAVIAALVDSTFHQEGGDDASAMLYGAGRMEEFNQAEAYPCEMVLRSIAAALRGEP